MHTLTWRQMVRYTRAARRRAARDAGAMMAAVAANALTGRTHRKTTPENDAMNGDR